MNSYNKTVILRICSFFCCLVGKSSKCKGYNSCYKDGACQFKVQTKTYVCKCAKGRTGRLCEKGGAVHMLLYSCQGPICYLSSCMRATHGQINHTEEISKPLLMFVWFRIVFGRQFSSMCLTQHAHVVHLQLHYVKYRTINLAFTNSATTPILFVTEKLHLHTKIAE